MRPLSRHGPRFARAMCGSLSGVTDAIFLSRFFELVEALTHTSLTTTSKKLLMAYIAEAEDTALADRARSAILRYIQKEIPTVEELRQKSQTSELSKLDHLILKMEYEAGRVR